MRCDGELIVERARRWLGTPAQYQGNIKGLGADCAGFVAEALREAGAHVEEGAGAVTSIFRSAEFVASLEEAEPGDVVVMCDELRRRPDEPRHVGILTHRRHDSQTPYMIHAGREKVIEHIVDLSFRLRIHSIWRPVRCETN